MVIRVLVLAAALVFAGCKDKAKEQRRNDLRALMHGTKPDPEIKAAMDKAQQNVPEFLAALQNPGPNRSHFMVRKVFPAKDAAQQILLVTNLRYDGNLLHGKLDDNTAVAGSGIPKDGNVSFPPSEVVDWMYNDGGFAVGGFMLRALKSKMTEEEWAGVTRQVKFKE
jgi:uncharacterized protein YegJ (DUF2314 family)